MKDRIQGKSYRLVVQNPSIHVKGVLLQTRANRSELFALNLDWFKCDGEGRAGSSRDGNQFLFVRMKVIASTLTNISLTGILVAITKMEHPLVRTGLDMLAVKIKGL